MRRQRLVLFVLLIGVLTLTSIASAQSAPRVIPTNDNFANAKPITIGKSYTVLDIGAATVEAGQPGVTGCGGASGINHSVWFSVQLPITSTIHLSTEGTYLSHPIFESVDTIIAVFTGGSLGTLTQIACNDDSSGLLSELTVGILSGTTHYILVGTYSANPYGPTSVLKLNTRMRITAISIANYDFEQPLTPADWKVKNSTNDDRHCSDPSYPSLSGVCAFRFLGNAGEASKLSQTFPLPSFFVPRKNGVLTMYLYYRVMDAPLGPAKLTLKASYLDGTPSNKTVVDLTGVTPTGGYLTLQRVLYLASGKVAGIRVDAQFKSTAGTLLLDDVNLYYTALPSTREGVLPLPAVK